MAPECGWESAKSVTRYQTQQGTHARDAKIRNSWQSPLSYPKTKALMPVANRPLLEYTLHFLVAAGIQEICVFCCSHANKIVQYLSDAGWTSDAAPCQVTTQVSEDSLSPGDALRLIYDRSLIRTDFVLVMGDLVSTINLQPIIQQHKQRRLKDKVTVMTMVFREAAPRHHTRSTDDDVVLVTEKDTDRVLHYQMVEGQSKLDLPLMVPYGRRKSTVTGPAVLLISFLERLTGLPDMSRKA
ncbi:Translation initiation factor eIF-2B subunit epsilon [Branchiostoma belcheri]|nr:Translation initiation factor eIF-2B subunit epsilon [Branchiostoma belcheri]